MSMQLSNERYEQIKESVVQLYEQCDVHCTPISGYEIAVRLGVKVIPYSALSAANRSKALRFSNDGFSAFENGEWRICVNDDSSIVYGRINFTLLHEIGHIWLKHTEASDLADAEADFFAKFAQCPPVLIYKYGLTNVGQIMNRFEISYGAACNAFDYYHKWLRYGSRNYTDYEIKTCRLFGVA